MLLLLLLLCCAPLLRVLAVAGSGSYARLAARAGCGGAAMRDWRGWALWLAMAMAMARQTDV